MPLRTACAIDLQPGDIVAPKPDMNLVQISYQLSQRSDKYLNDQKVSDQTKLNAGQFQLRYLHTFDTRQMPSVVYLNTPIGYTHPGGSLTASYQPQSGLGDTTLVYAVWPYVNHATKDYLVLGAYLKVPTGNYEAANGAVNMGQNRVSGAMQAGYQTALTEKINWMTALDAVWFGTNHDFKVNQLSSIKRTFDQNTLYTLQTGLQYRIDPQWSVAAAYFYTAGGETSLNDVANNDESQLQRYQISLASRFSFGRVLLQYGSDIKTKNGYFEDSQVILRFITAF